MRAKRVITLVIQNHGVSANEGILVKVDLDVLAVTPCGLRILQRQVIKRVLLPLLNGRVTGIRVAQMLMTFAVINREYGAP